MNAGARERVLSEEAGRAGRIGEGRASEGVGRAGEGVGRAAEGAGRISDEVRVLSKDAGLLSDELGLLSDVIARGGLGASAKRIGLSGVEPIFVRERAGKDEVA